MGENESSRANSLALLVFTPFALQKAGARRRIARGCPATSPAGQPSAVAIYSRQMARTMRRFSPPYVRLELYFVEF